MTGCDTNSATSEVSISPSAVTLQAGQSQEFVASGGYTYSWSLPSPSIGSLSGSSGDRVTYTAPSTIPTNGTQTITVISTIPGTSSGSTTTATNGTATTTTTAGYQVTGQATVNFN